MKYNFSIREKKFEVEVGEVSESLAKVNVNGVSYDVGIENPSAAKPIPAAIPAMPAVPKRASAPVSAPAAPRPVAAPQTPPSASATSGGTVKAPIPGLILDVKVKVGDRVAAGQTVATMEAMKMENRLVSHIAGTVKEIRVQKGTEVSTGDVIMIVE